jgi:hypothetical protein
VDEALRGLARFDVIIIGDAGARDIPPELQRRIAEWFGSKPGAGLVLYGLRTLAAGPANLSTLSPLRLPPGVLGRYAAVSLDPLGVLRLSSGGATDPTEHLPPVWTPRGAARLVPGSVVLARVAPGGEKSTPVVALAKRGSARVVAIALNDLWRWAFMPLGVGREGDYYAEFWHSLVRWLALPEGISRLAVAPDRLNFNSAEPVGFSAGLFDNDLNPLDDGEILLLWRREADDGGYGEGVYLRRLEGAPGRYRVEIGALPPGRYAYRAVATRGEAEIGTAEGSFAVGRYSLETAGLPVNDRLLARLAGITGGRLISPDSLNQAAGIIGLEKKKAVLKSEISAPRGIPVFLAILLALALEWLLRRRRGIR